MSQISELNALMPTKLDKTTREYEAIFGKEDFTPAGTITQSSDFNCGAVANELEYARGFLDYITRARLIDDFSDTYLEKIVYYFTGIRRAYGESDASLRNRFRALVIRGNNPSWVTDWMIRDVFEYFFDPAIIYVRDNFISDNLITDPGFELDPAVNWTKVEAGTSTVTYPSLDHNFEGSVCAKISVDAAGSDVQLSQVIHAVAEGHYVLDWFGADDQGMPVGATLYKVTLHSGDGHYYDFASLTWQVAETHLEVARNPTARYEAQQAFVDVPAGMAGQDITLTFENIGGTAQAYVFYIDLVQWGTMLAYPSVELLLVNVGVNPNFLSVWPGTGDPVPGLDYDFASYYGNAYLFGIGGNSMEYYMALLNIVKTSGVSPHITVVGRATS